MASPAGHRAHAHPVSPAAGSTSSPRIADGWLTCGVDRRLAVAGGLSAALWALILWALA